MSHIMSFPKNEQTYPARVKIIGWPHSSHHRAEQNVLSHDNWYFFSQNIGPYAQSHHHLGPFYNTTVLGARSLISIRKAEVCSNRTI